MNAIQLLSDVGGTIRKYKKKPVVVRAVELTKRVRIRTREGELAGEPGDFLIEGIKGEVYPCGKDIFHATYEEVSE